jgi:hypothetical protein
MIAKHVMPITGVMNICSAGAMEMKCDRDTGQGPEQSGARSDLANNRPDEASNHQDEALDENPRQTRFPAL